MNKVRKTPRGRTGNDTGYILSFSLCLSLSEACAVSDSAAEGS